MLAKDNGRTYTSKYVGEKNKTIRKDRNARLMHCKLKLGNSEGNHLENKCFPFKWLNQWEVSLKRI